MKKKFFLFVGFLISLNLSYAAAPKVSQTIIDYNYEDQIDKESGDYLKLKPTNDKELIERLVKKRYEIKKIEFVSPMDLKVSASGTSFNISSRFTSDLQIIKNILEGNTEYELISDLSKFRAHEADKDVQNSRDYSLFIRDIYVREKVTKKTVDLETFLISYRFNKAVSKIKSLFSSCEN